VDNPSHSVSGWVCITKKGIIHRVRIIHYELYDSNLKRGDKVETLKWNCCNAKNTQKSLTVGSILHRNHPQKREQLRCTGIIARPNSQFSLSEKVESKNIKHHPTVYWQCLEYYCWP